VIAETACSRAIFGSSRRSAPGKDLNGDLKQMGLSDVAQYWSNVFKSMPGMAGLLAALAVLGVLVVVIGIEAARRRELSLHLHALSEAMDEQSRLMERMRRSLTDIMEVLVSLESESRYRAENTPADRNEAEPAVSPVSASALRQELELLKAEMSAELPVGPTLD
jgi:hypothetical protein